MSRRERVVVYVEREDGLLVFEHRDHPEAGVQVPAGGVHRGEALIDAVIREVFEETGIRLDAEPRLLATHEHLDGLGRPARSHFFRVDAPGGLPRTWQHAVSGAGDDAGLVFACRFDPAPELWPVQAVFRPVGKPSGNAGPRHDDLARPAVPDVTELERRMRPGRWSDGGFLGANERLEEVLAADRRTLAELGLARQEIVEPLSLLIDAPYTVMPDWSDELGSLTRSHPEWEVERLEPLREAVAQRFGRVECKGPFAARVGGRYEVVVAAYLGYVACPWGTAFPEASCGRGSGDWWIRDTTRGLGLRGPSLITHLIEKHGFFEGFESPYRVDPAALAEMLELGPLATT